MIGLAAVAYMVSRVLSEPATGPDAAYSHQLRVNSSGQFEHRTYDGNQRLVRGSTVADPGRWYHVAGVAAQNGRVRLFVNGREEGTPVGDIAVLARSHGHAEAIGAALEAVGLKARVVDLEAFAIANARSVGPLPL